MKECYSMDSYIGGSSFNYLFYFFACVGPPSKLHLCSLFPNKVHSCGLKYVVDHLDESYRIDISCL